MLPMFSPLPFEGYSWPFTQHYPALDRDNLRGLLEVANSFSGEAPATKEISQQLVERRILTANVRQDTQRPDAWRDYQQVLAELGLMVSTEVSSNITVTTLGLEYLDRTLSHADLLTTQALRYQYPNGYKVRGSIYKRQIENGVLIRPAVLFLKTLLQLTEADQDPFLATDEIQGFLLPIMTLQEDVSLEDLLEFRRAGAKQTVPHSHARRNVQDWMKFLGTTALFSYNNGRVSLREAATRDNVDLRSLVEIYSDEESFWSPTESRLRNDKPRVGTRLSWFDFYGSPPIEQKWEAIGRSPARGLPTGFGAPEDVADEDEPTERIRQGGIALRAVDTAIVPTPGKRPRVVPKTPEQLEQVYATTEKQRILHDVIVQELAEICQQNGAEVREDPNSIDLLVTAGNERTIIEVKTITKGKYPTRIRLGAGQLLEYQYRFCKQEGDELKPSLALVVSSMVNDEIVHGFLRDHLGCTLIMRRGPSDYKVLPSGGSSLATLLSVVEEDH